MEISIKYGYAFLCNQKCASSSARTMLRRYSDISFNGRFKHTNYLKYEAFIGPFLESFPGAKVETIAIFREPIDHLYSWYRFRSRPEIDGTPYSTSSLSFADFVEAFLSPNPPKFARITPQLRFFQNANQEVGVDRVFPFEELDLFVDYMSSLIGKQLKFPSKNVSPVKSEPQDLLATLESELCARVRERLEEDIEFHQSLLRAKQEA